MQNGLPLGEEKGAYAGGNKCPKVTGTKWPLAGTVGVGLAVGNAGIWAFCRRSLGHGLTGTHHSQAASTHHSDIIKRSWTQNSPFLAVGGHHLAGLCRNNRDQPQTLTPSCQPASPGTCPHTNAGRMFEHLRPRPCWSQEEGGGDSQVSGQGADGEYVALGVVGKRGFGM